MQIIINMSTIPENFVTNNQILKDEIYSWLSDLGCEIGTIEMNVIPKSKQPKKPKPGKIDLNKLPPD